MRVVDQDGLDGIFARGSAGRAQLGPRRPPRRESAGGLAALAEATRPAAALEAPALASWTELEPLALVATEAPEVAARATRDTRVDDTMPTRLPDGDAWGLPPTRIGRFARPTLKPPLGAPVRRIVLSFLVGGAALVAAVILLALRGSNGDPAGAVVAAPASAARAVPERGELSPVRVSSARAAAAAAAASGAPPDPRPVRAATIDDRAMRRRPLLPPRAVLPGGRLEWRLPARFSFGGEAPDVTDDEAVAALVSTLVERCEPGTLVVTGHTCNVGSELYNVFIGKRRALYARDLLVSAGLPGAGLRVVSAASLRPEASNATAAGRVRNRRVTVACQPLRHERSTR